MKRSVEASCFCWGGSGRLGRGKALLALDDELGEPADVLDCATVGHLDHPLGHRAQEVAVVADEEDGPRPLRPSAARARRPTRRRGGWSASSSTSRSGADSIRRASATLHAPAAGEAPGPDDRRRRSRRSPARRAPTGLGLDAVAAEGLEAVLRSAVGVRARRSTPRVRVLRPVGRSASATSCARRTRLLLELGHVRRATQHLVDDRACRTCSVSSWGR